MCSGSDCDADAVDRRQFLVSATVALAGLTGTPAIGQTRPPTRVLDDPSVRHGSVDFGPSGPVGGYLARPKADGRFPAVLVVAGNLITEEYIPNTCAALAVAGFVGLAPNIFHPVPTGATPEEMNKALAGRTDADYLNDIQAGADFLRRHESVASAPAGVLGFCSGGRRAMMYAAKFSGVGAVVAFHTSSNTVGADIMGLRAPTLLHHGTGDRVSPHTITLSVEKELRSRGTTVEVFLYDGAEHGFLAYTRHPEYNPEAAQLAWSRTIAFLRRYLKG
jgi:carboxymethylenebutenolidase